MKKSISILLLALLITVSTVPASAIGESSLDPPPISIAPMYAYITALATSFTINSSGLSTCEGSVISMTGSTANLTVMLQQYKSGSWQLYDEWKTSGVSKYGVELAKTRYVNSGYTYRVVVTASIYDASGKLLESKSITSSERTY